MSFLLLDDHLLRDVLADDVPSSLTRLLRHRDVATTNYWYFRLCKSAVSARGGQLMGAWPAERRRDVGRILVALPEEIHVVPIRPLAFRMAEIADRHRVSSLGAEAVAAAEALNALICVWDGDDGPGIRAAAADFRVQYRTFHR